MSAETSAAPKPGFLDLMRALADDDDLALPIMSHPSFSGSYVLNPESGIGHGVLYGQL